MLERLKYKTLWVVWRYDNEAAFLARDHYQVSTIQGNLLLNVGIAALFDLAITTGETKFDNANARIGVGDSAAAEAAAQTGLQAAVNTTYKAMAATYPSRAAQTVTWQSVFASGDANYAWNEFTIDNGTAAKSLNRKVSSQGTKVVGQVWTVNLQITLS
mgnify:CR=1 FL=1